jgi:zinc protease
MAIKSLIPLVVVACLPSLCQETEAPKPDSMKGVVRKNLAPVSSQVLHVKLPRPVERKLKNGLEVLVLENHRAPVVTLELLLPASTLHDPPSLPGLAEAVTEMLKQGTPTRTSLQIAQELSEMGASLGADVAWGSHNSRLSASALTENLDPLLALASDVLLNANFPQDEFDKWKRRKLTSLLQQRSQPTFLGTERMAQVLFPGDPRGTVSATAESIARMTRQDLLDFRKRFYVPSGSILGVTGDTTPDQIVAKLEKALAAWEGGGVGEPSLSSRPLVANKRIYLVNRPDSVQTYLILGNHAIDRLSPDYIPCMVLNRILGSGPSSRLFVKIREEKGFTYGVYSRFRADKYLDEFSASSSVRTEVTGPALDEFLKEFRKIREEPVPKEELENAERAIVAGFALSIERQAGVLGQMLQLREYGLPADYWDTYPTKVMAVTAGDVQRVARKYIPLDNVQIVAVGEGTKIRDVLKKYGPVEEYNADGKKID